LLRLFLFGILLLDVAPFAPMRVRRAWRRTDKVQADCDALHVHQIAIAINAILGNSLVTRRLVVKVTVALRETPEALLGEFLNLKPSVLTI
jgi:hypothetical protein